MLPDRRDRPDRRLAALLAGLAAASLLVACGSSSKSDSHIITTLRPAPTTTAPVRPANIELRQVLSQKTVACGTASVTPSKLAVTASGSVVGSTAGAPPCTEYQVGPAVITAKDLGQALPVPAPTGTWSLNVSATPAAALKANAFFNACFHTEATCPASDGAAHGQVVILVDGLVQAAPIVAISDLARGSFQIGGLTQEKARQLAAGLGSESH